MPEEVTQDVLLDGKVQLLQPRRGHRVGTDAVLLAASVAIRPGEILGDFGSASGAVGLMVAARVPGIGLTFVDRDPALLDLACRNLKLNVSPPDPAAEFVAVDLLGPGAERRAAGLAPGSLDVVATNPPYLVEARAQVSGDAGRASAHAMPQDGLARWVKACADALKPKGRIVLVHRADALADCLRAFEKGFGGIRLRFVHPRAGEPAGRLLIAAIKGSRAPLVIATPLVVHQEDGSFTEEAALIHKGAAAPF